jgi:type I restriction enzyme S subunit
MYPSPQSPSYENYGRQFGLSSTQLYLKVFNERYAVFSWSARAICVSLGLIKTFNKYVSPYYLVIWPNCPIEREKCSANTYGAGHSQGNLNLSLINNFVIPLRPFNEQKRIVAKVRQLLILCDELEQRVMENQKNSEFLMEAVLKETFSS